MFLELFHTFCQLFTITANVFDVLCILSHNESLSNDDLKQLAELCIDNKITAVDLEEDIPFRTLTAEFLKSSFTNITQIMDQFIGQNPVDEQSSKAR
ncbi:hypothetical protein T4D_6809 [Trichinella pseudospiralis]|uniref:Uncharacterized protein n=1 Tax=Trichinella pseudospiralis TaxID=6337 RepID=A0A0V1FE78_TRIPS|nr:hypothetical protein T4D_6809 [Trichinella pseudospiralis]